MLSFVATAAAWGQSAFAFKAVSLAIHLATGGIIFVLLSRLFNRDCLFRNRRFWYAAGIAAVWVLHPMFVSTVLYVVQRMAMLSALFTALALLAFVTGRLRLEDGARGAGLAWLFLGVPAFTVLAALSKETGLLAPLLCAVLEWTHFHPARGKRRPPEARWFMGLFVAVPVLGGSLFLLLNPDFFTSGYANRPFDLVERLLTQTRVLFDYVGNLLLPAGRQLSLYRDDYMISTGLFTPWTTFFAIAGWIGLVGLAVTLRRTIPGLAAGLGLYLVGHAMESSIFPLLIYFEHRNYLPGLGILIAIASVLAYIAQAVSARMDHPGRVFGAAFAGLLLALSFATLARALAWQSPTHLLEQAVAQYPDSRFARMELAALIMNRAPNADYRAAIDHYRHLQGLELPSTRAIGYLGEMAVSCFALGETDPENLDKAFSEQPETIQADYLKSVHEVARLVRQQPCKGVPIIDYADQLVAVADGTHLSQGRHTVWRLRFEAAQLYAAQERNRKALEQARQAWETGNADLPVGMMIAGLHIRLGEFGAAAKLLDQIAPRIPEDDQIGRALLEQYRSAIEDGAQRSILAPDIDG